MDWKHTIDMADGPQRDMELTSQLRQLPYLEDIELRSETRRLIEAEYSLQDEDELRDVTIARLHSILTLNDDAAHKVATTYDSVMNTMPGDIAFRRAAVVQTVARHQFSVEEEARLRDLFPSVLGEKPKELQSATSGSPLVKETKGRPWWKFWGTKPADDPDKEVVIPDIEDRGYSDNMVEELRRMRQY
ncbi:MAG TPA: hypothetical protein VH951_00050 [Dehalococcoidia bacterium]